MAAVTITLWDTEDGEVKCKFAFDPPVNADSIDTKAQQAASIMMQALENFFERADGDDD